MSVKKTVIGMGFTIAMFTSGAFGGTPQVFLSIVDTVLCPNVADPNGNGRLLTIRMNNPAVHVGGFSISLSIADPSIINFAYTTIDTVPPHWQRYWTCLPNPPGICHWDSILQCPDSCFNHNAQVVTSGTRSATFDLVQSDRLSETVLQVNGVVQTNAGPVLQPGNGVLFRVPLTIFPISDSVPLSQRQVKIYFDSAFTSVSDSTGNTVWRIADTTLALTHGTVTIPYSTKGDCNFDCQLTPADVVYELGWVFNGSPTPLPASSVADVNCDGNWTPADVVILLSKVFNGVPLPC